MSMDFSKSGYEEFRKKIADSFSEESLQVIDQAFDLAFRAHHEQKRKSGEPYIIHPIAVADILFQLGMDPPSLETALLHDVVEDTPVTLDEIRAQFGDEVANLVDGVTKIGKIPLFTREEQQAENLRKMLLAMCRDVRVILVKLADRLHNLRTLGVMRPDKRRRIAKESLLRRAHSVRNFLKESKKKSGSVFCRSAVMLRLKAESKASTGFTGKCIFKIRILIRFMIFTPFVSL